MTSGGWISLPRIVTLREDPRAVQKTLHMVTKALEDQGFGLQAKKVQRTSPWKYLRLKIMETTITPQPITIKDNP